MSKPALLLRVASRRQLNRLAVGSVPVSAGPCFLPTRESRRIAQALGGDEALQRREPMLVVMRAIVRLAAIGGCLEFVCERGGPLFPSEMPSLGKFHSERERLRLPGLAKDGPAI